MVENEGNFKQIKFKTIKEFNNQKTTHLTTNLNPF